MSSRRSRSPKVKGTEVSATVQDPILLPSRQHFEPPQPATRGRPARIKAAERCEDCRVTNAFHQWRSQHLTPAYSWMIDFPAVPAGKRAVIELVTATITVPSGERARFRMYTSLGTAPSNLDLLLTPQGKVAGREFLVATHSLRVYSDHLIEFAVGRDNATTEGDLFVCISGYLIDV